MEPVREIAVVARAEVSRTFRSARIIVLFLLYAMFSGVVLLVVGAIANALNAQIESAAASGEDVDRALAEVRSSFLGFLFDADATMLESLRKLPLVVLVVFKITLFFLPAYVALMGFDQISGEVGPRSIRYLAVRARRSSVLFGKFVAQASVLLALVLSIDLGIFVYAAATNESFGIGAVAPALLRFWAAAIVFSLAYLALTSLCSTLFRSPAVSLVFNFIALFTFWILNAISSFGIKRDLVEGLWQEEATSPVAYLRYLTPSHYSSDLLHPALSHFGISVAAFVAFTAVFLAAAWAVLRTRDV